MRRDPISGSSSPKILANNTSVFLLVSEALDLYILNLSSNDCVHLNSPRKIRKKSTWLSHLQKWI